MAFYYNGCRVDSVGMAEPRLIGQNCLQTGKPITAADKVYQVEDGLVLEDHINEWYIENMLHDHIINKYGVAWDACLFID